MEYKKQTKLYQPEKGIRGNCMMACYANYLGLEINQVPAIEELFECTKPNGFWFSVVCLWWEEMGYKYFWSPNIEEMPKEIFQGIYFVSGLSKRGVHHLVMYKNGEMLFDPHPDNSGIIEPIHYEWVTESKT